MDVNTHVERRRASAFDKYRGIAQSDIDQSIIFPQRRICLRLSAARVFMNYKEHV